MNEVNPMAIRFKQMLHDLNATEAYPDEGVTYLAAALLVVADVIDDIAADGIDRNRERRT